MKTGTDIDNVLIVADEQVSEDAGLIEVSQADHVLHAVDGGRVHWFDVGGILRRYPVFLHPHTHTQNRQTLLMELYFLISNEAVWLRHTLVSQSALYFLFYFKSLVFSAVAVSCTSAAFIHFCPGYLRAAAELLARRSLQ